MKIIIYTGASGNLCYTRPVINSVGERPGFNEDDALARALAKLPSDATDPRVVEPSAIPVDRTFRNAWRQAGATIEHDMPKARTIAQDRVREARIPRFVHWDALWNKAQEDNDTAVMAMIKANRQKLRDAPADARIVNAADETALKAAMQAVIGDLP